MPHAPSVGDSQLSSSNRMSWARGSMPTASRLCRVDLLHLVGRRLENHLKLMVFEDPIRILSEAAVIGAPRRLHVRHVPRLRPEDAQQRFRMRRAGANLEVERLLNDASLRRPEGAHFEDEILEGHNRVMSFSTLIDRGSRSRWVAMMLRCSASSSRSIARSAVTPASSCGPTFRAAFRNACASATSSARGSPDTRPAG